MVHNTKRKTTEQFKQEVYEMYQDEYTVLGEYKNSKTKVLIKHNKCGNTWEATPNNFLRGAKCPHCSKSYHKKWTNEDFLQKVAKQVGNEYTFLDSYQGSDTKIRVKHNKCGNVYEITPYRFLNQKQRCPKCAIIIRAEKNRKTPKKKKKRVSPLKKTNEQFKHEVKEAVGNEYTFLEPYVNSYTKIRVKHNKCGHVYTISPHQFLGGSRCRYCSSNHRLTTEEFKQWLHNKYGDEYTLLSDYVNSRTRVKIRHNKCGNVWETSPDSLKQGKGCPKCAIEKNTQAKRMTNDQFVARVKEQVGNEYTVVGTYVDSQTKIKMKHNKCGTVWEIKPNNFLNGQRCPTCCANHYDKMTQKEFEKRVYDVLGKDYKVIGTYNGLDKPIEIKHLKCGRIYKTRATNIVCRHHGCIYCNTTPKKTTEQFKKELKEEYGNRYTLVSEYKSAKTNVTIRCNKCGHTWETHPNYILGHSSGCPYCNQSHGEVFISELLINNNINYDYPKKFTDLKDKEMLHYDFFIPDQNTLIEYQGIQHYQSLGIFGGDKQYELQQKHDQMKRKYAKDHGYSLIEVPYTEDTLGKVKNYLVSYGLKLTNNSY